MSARRAVLIGVPKNKRDASLDLPVVRNDVSLLHDALESCGYAVTSLGLDEPSDVSGNSIEDAISDACASAPPDSTLVLYFSGHGIHFNGKDLLVPWDAHFADPTRFEKSLVDADISRYVERSQARSVVFFIDACREGINWELKSLSMKRWGQGQREQAARQQSVLVYSCQPGEFSQYVGGGEGFSLFSKALATVLASTHPAESVKDVVRATQVELDKLVKEFDKGPQHVRVAGEQEPDSDHLSFKISDGSVVEGSARGADAQWGTVARESRLWRAAEAFERPGGPQLVERAAALVEACEQQWSAMRSGLPGEPWCDHTYPLRVVACLEMLLGPARQFSLSPSEVYLLLAAPFLREGVYSSALAEMAKAEPLILTGAGRPYSPARRRLETTHAAHPQLIRKAKRTDDAASRDAIAYWLLHRCVSRDPSTWQFKPEGNISAALSDALDAANAERDGVGFTRQQLMEFAQCVGCDPARIERADRAYVLRARVIVGAGAYEQQIRERLIGYLLCLAGWMALDVRVMSEVLPDHLGIADPVYPEELLSSLRSANWRSVGAGRSVDVSCRHPAVDYSIRDLVIRANDVLYAIHRSAHQTGVLRDDLSLLPTRLGTELIRPLAKDGKASYETPHLNFHLAHDEVRELLMGEQLYDQPELAIRELYQNALDACRYKRARLQYLERTGQFDPATRWEGQIEFEQGSDSTKGRYIECRDNGIGMSRREIDACFAKAGKRFCDLPEFIEEQNEWARCAPPIRMYPNSQFGVGVFSYFMLADELEIETCRMDRKGRPGTRLLITIPGSGSLFRVQELGPGAETGTRVRLYLRQTQEMKQLSCIKTLRRLLWVSEFRVWARHGWRRAEWQPGVLRHPSRRKHAFPKDPVLPIWWTTERGQILADGITVSVDDDHNEPTVGSILSTGVVVNFTEEYKPSLTVDRRKARRFDKGWLVESAQLSLRAVLDWEELSYMWLWSMLSVFPDAEPYFNRELRERNRLLTFTGRVEGRHRDLKYSDYGNDFLNDMEVRIGSRRGMSLLDKLNRRVFYAGMRPTIHMTYHSETIKPGQIGLNRIRTGDVDIRSSDVLLFRLIWTAWCWELDDRKGKRVRPRITFSRLESLRERLDKNKTALLNETEFAIGNLKVEDRILRWFELLRLDGVARLETWQRAGLVLPMWLVELLNKMKVNSLREQYFLKAVPKTGEAWLYTRHRAIEFLMWARTSIFKSAPTTLFTIILLIVLYYMIMGAIVLTKNALR